jgi:hypothetical protein
VDRERNDRLGWRWRDRRYFLEHRRQILRPIHRDANADTHTNTHGNGEPYTLTIYANSHCDTESDADAYRFTNALANTNTQWFSHYSRRDFYPFARGNG